MKKKKKVLVALSGGVDSSVAAALLVHAGYDVVGAFMVQYSGETSPGVPCWHADYRDAVRVAAHLGIPILKFDFTVEYEAHVLSYLYQEYNAGRTPNPDVLCNTYLKFGVWLEKAKTLGFEALATGHYARIGMKKIKGNQLVQLLRARDDNKDQTYFLHQLSQEQLRHVLFPIGEYTKPEVRALAKKFDLPIADKEESMGICFVGEVPMKEFLQKKIEKKKGKIVRTSGEVIGQHDGLSFYTIGQRHLGIGNIGSRPLYVVEKRAGSNELVVGEEDDPLLYKKEMAMEEVHWVSGQAPSFPLECLVRLRHRQPLKACRVEKKNDGLVIFFRSKERAVTPGQFAVFYTSRECLGGGVIG